MNSAYEFIELIKTIAIGAVRSEEPTSTEFGEVKTVKPLKIDMGGYTVSEKEELFVVTRRIKELIDSDKLKKGDSVLILKEEGGESWIVLDAVEVDD